MLAKFTYEGVADRYASKEFGVRDKFEDFGLRAHIYNLKRDGNNIITYIDDIPLVKNPKTLKDFPPDCRGVLTKDGELYVIADAFRLIHVDILSKMKQKGIISEQPVSWEDLTKRVPDEFICVQRVWNKDVFALSDSYVLPKKEGREEVLELFKPFIILGNKKHPQFKFTNENAIRTAKRILTPEERMDRKKYNVGFFINESIEDVLKPKSQKQIEKDLSKFDAEELYQKWRDTENEAFLVHSLQKGMGYLTEDDILYVLELNDEELTDKVFPLIIKSFPYVIKKINKYTYEMYVDDLGELADMMYWDVMSEIDIQKILSGDSFDMFYVSQSDIDLDNYDYEIKILNDKKIDIEKLKHFVKRELDIDENMLADIYKEVKNFPESSSFKILKQTLAECQTIATESMMNDFVMNLIKENIGVPKYKDDKYYIRLTKERVINVFKSMFSDFKFEIKNPYRWYGDISDYPRVFEEVLEEKISENESDLNESFLFKLKPISEIKKGLKDIPQRRKNSFLLLNVVRENVYLVKILLENGADVNTVDSDNTSALFYAVKYNNYDMAEILLKNGANPNLYGDYDKTPLELSIEKYNMPITKLLISYNAKQIDKAINKAYQFDNIEAIKYLESLKK